MPAKKKDDSEGKTEKALRKTVCCGVRGPGPKYKLKTVVGYKDHCLSKWREPAYTLAMRAYDRLDCKSPGPKYYPKLCPGIAYSFPKDKNKPKLPCTPGPKYMLPAGCSVAYSMSWRHPTRCKPGPGPYLLKPFPPGPSYPFGLKFKDPKCQTQPPYYDIGKVCLPSTKPCAPIYSLTGRHPGRPDCRSPGPKYLPKPIPCEGPKGITQGIKWSPCVISNRTPEDELC